MGTTNILDLNNRLTKVEKENVAQNSYTSLKNKPKINSVTLSGNKSLADIGAAAAADLTTLAGDVGDLSVLTTTDKSSCVGAINEVNGKLIVPEDITITKNADYVGSAWVRAMKVGKMVICSGRFEVTTEKPTGQTYALFSNLPAPYKNSPICDTGNNSIILSDIGTITSNNAIPVGFYNISVAYISA